MRIRYPAAIAVVLSIGVIPTAAHAEIDGTMHTQQFIAESPQTSCTLTYQSITYPGSSTKTVKVNGEMDCNPGVATVQGDTVPYLYGTNTQYRSGGAWYCEDPTPPFNRCASPGHPVSVGWTLQNVPNGTYVDYHLQDFVMTITNPEGQLDPWVITPFDYGCVPGGTSVSCYEPFVATDPEKIDTNP